ncbi:MAG TPA: c-type cytochrome [Burkholderiaceae bacterium]|jgi:cytochrome c553|nr:c-type cytochrome [Burkholderiaceae bacterium]
MPSTTIVHAMAGLLLVAAAPAFGDADRAKELAATVCAGCHGPDGNSPAPTFPKLAGVQREYLAKQLNDYFVGARKHYTMVRKREAEMMAPIVSTLQRDEVGPLAAWYAAQKPAPGVVEDTKLAEAGRRIYLDGNPDSGIAACVGCHGENGVGHPRYPRLAGQYQAYTIEQLNQFRSGARSNDRGRVMRLLAARMTDEEIKAVAEYIAGL